MWSKLINCACGEKWADVAPLVLRVALGAVFASHGYTKVFERGHDAVTSMLTGLGFPAASLFAYILAYGELIAGILLIVGFIMHWAAKFAVVVAAVAFFTVHMPKGYGDSEFIILIFAAAVSVLITGPGKYSLDALRAKKEQPTM